MRSLRAPVLAITLLAVFLAGTANAGISFTLGGNTWRFVSREWSVVPNPVGGYKFLPAVPATNSVPVIAGMELRGSFIVDNTFPDTVPPIDYPPGLAANPEFGGIFGGLYLSASSPAFTPGGGKLWFTGGPEGAPFIKMAYDEGAPGTHWDNASGASGAAISAQDASLDAAWQAATKVADGTPILSGLFHPLFTAGVETIYLTGTASFNPLKGSVAVTQDTAYVDIDPLAAMGVIFDTNLYPFGTDMQLNSLVYGSDPVGSNAWYPKVVNTAGPGVGAVGASGIDNDPVLVTVVPEPASCVVWTFLFGAALLAGRRFRRR